MDQKRLEEMVALAAAKLNMSPSRLKSAAMSGNVEEILSKMDEKSAEKIRTAMSDKALTDRLAEKLKK